MIEVSCIIGEHRDNLPWKFEAEYSKYRRSHWIGRCHDYWKKSGWRNIQQHMNRNSLLSLTKDARDGRCDGLQAVTHDILGCGFTIDGIHPHDVRNARYGRVCSSCRTSLCTTFNRIARCTGNMSCKVLYL